MSKKKKIIILIIVFLIIILVIIAGIFIKPVSGGFCGIGDDIGPGDFKDCICIGKKEVISLWNKGAYGVEIKCKGLMFGIITR